jgi:hypothetical protein
MWIAADTAAKPIAARYGRPVTASTRPPPAVEATPISANTTSLSTRYLAIAFQIACSAPAPMTIATIGTVIWLWAIRPGYAASAA